MPRYFFHIKSADGTVIDLEGSEHDSLDPLRKEASDAAREIMSQCILQGKPANGRSFIVTDEAGEVVLEYPFKEAINER